MDNCGGGGQRLPPDGDEFPAAYQEFNSLNQQYQYVTTRDPMTTNGDVDHDESVVDGTTFVPADKAMIVSKTLNIAETRSIFDKKDMGELKQSGLLNMDSEKRTSVNSYVLYSAQKNVVPQNLMMEKKIEISGYYSKDEFIKTSDVDFDLDNCPPPLPLTRPPKVDSYSEQDKKFSQNGDWRQDNKSEKSVKDKIAMFSSQGNLEAPLFPTNVVATSGSPSSNGNSRRLAKHKSSDDVFSDDKKSTMPDRTQSSFDLSPTHHQKAPSLPQTSPPPIPSNCNGHSSTSSPNYLQKTLENNKYPLVSSNNSSKSNSPLHSYEASYNNGINSLITGSNKIYEDTSSTTKSTNGLMRATSFSGSTSLYNNDKVQTSSELLGSTTSITRTNSLASTFKRPNDEMRKSSLNQLIEQRRKGISKLRGLVIPEKDAVPIDQPIMDLPEIKSRDSILVNQVPRSNIQDKWGSQSSLASNASTVSSSVKTNPTFKMPAPKILSNYSPAFKRKSLTVYNNQSNSPPVMNNSKNNNNNNQLSSPASDAPKSLESICSPTKSDYSFDFVSSSGSPDNTLPVSKPKSNCQRKIGRNEYDDSDNDSAVSSSQSSISRGFSPPMSPVPSDRSTISSERSYLSSETHYQRSQLILDNSHKSNGTTVVSEKNIYTSSNARATFLADKSLSTSDKHLKPSQQHQVNDTVRSSQIPQRQMLKRCSSTETNSSNSSTLTSGSQASSESLSRRVLKPQSVEAINRKNILASARCRSGQDLNGSPLIQRKFKDEDGNPVKAPLENGGFIDTHGVTNGNVDLIKPETKIAYIEITENLVNEGDKVLHEEELLPPRLPPKRSIIPQSKNVPIPSTRPPKPDMMEPSNDMISWVRAEVRSLAHNNADRTNSYDSRKKSSLCDMDNVASNNRNFKSKSSLTLNEQSSFDLRSQLTRGEADMDLVDTIKPQPRSNLVMKKAVGDHEDLLTVLTTKSRSRSGIHVEETCYGKLKSQMSLEDILAVKSDLPSKLPRSQSISNDDVIEKNGTSPFLSSSRILSNDYSKNNDTAERSVRRSNSNDSWTEEKIYPTKIPTLNRSCKDNSEELIDVESAKSANSCSKIPTPRNLSRRSSSVTDMKKVFEKAELSSSSGTSSPGGQLGITTTHNRFPSLDSSVDENIRPVGDVEQDRFNGEQFGSISSLASSTSLISQQELAQLVEEANLEEPRGNHDVIVVLLHKENPSGSVGITLAGGVDCETKEITIHRVLSHSIADKDGSVQRGDRILSINGRSMRGLTHRDSLAVLKQPRSEVVLVVSRAKLEDGLQQQPGTANRLKTRAESVETIVEGYEANGVVENTAWGPPLMVAVFKDGTGLGFSLEGGRDSPLGDRPLLIKKIFTGGAAEKTGALRAGDQLLEVNKRDVSKLSRIEAWSLMKKLPDGEVNLLVRHPATKSS